MFGEIQSPAFDALQIERIHGTQDILTISFVHQKFIEFHITGTERLTSAVKVIFVVSFTIKIHSMPGRQQRVLVDVRWLFVF